MPLTGETIPSMDSKGVSSDTQFGADIFNAMISICDSLYSLNPMALLTFLLCFRLIYSLKHGRPKRCRRKCHIDQRLR